MHGEDSSGRSSGRSPSSLGSDDGPGSTTAHHRYHSSFPSPLVPVAPRDDHHSKVSKTLEMALNGSAWSRRTKTTLTELLLAELLPAPAARRLASAGGSPGVIHSVGVKTLAARHAGARGSNSRSNEQKKDLS